MAEVRTIEAINTAITEANEKLNGIKATLKALDIDTQFEAYEAASAELMATRKVINALNTELKVSVRLANNTAVKQAEQAILMSIEQVLATLKVNELLGEPVARVIYLSERQSKNDKGEAVVEPSVVHINVQSELVTKVTGSKSKATGTATASKGRPVYVSPDKTQRLGAKAFVEAQGTEDEKGVKYPHTKAPVVLKRLNEAGQAWTVELPTPEVAK